MNGEAKPAHPGANVVVLYFDLHRDPPPRAGRPRSPGRPARTRIRSTGGDSLIELRPPSDIAHERMRGALPIAR